MPNRVGVFRLMPGNAEVPVAQGQSWHVKLFQRPEVWVMMANASGVAFHPLSPETTIVASTPNEDEHAPQYLWYPAVDVADGLPMRVQIKDGRPDADNEVEAVYIPQQGLPQGVSAPNIPELPSPEDR